MITKLSEKMNGDFEIYDECLFMKKELENGDTLRIMITKKPIDAKNDDEIRALCDRFGFNFERLTYNQQIHSSITRIVNEDEVSKSVEGDALITELKGTPLIIYTADCVPVLAYDIGGGVIGAAHCGWRGTYALLGQRMIEDMIKLKGSGVEDLRFVIGPSICCECYQVGEDLINKFNTVLTNKDDKFYIINDEGYYLDLWRANQLLLEAVGAERENIDVMGLCTSCNNEIFHSYRRDNGTCGRIGSIIQID